MNASCAGEIICKMPIVDSKENWEQIRGNDEAHNLTISCFVLISDLFNVFASETRLLCVEVRVRDMHCLLLHRITMHDVKWKREFATYVLNVAPLLFFNFQFILILTNNKTKNNN